MHTAKDSSTEMCQLNTDHEFYKLAGRLDQENNT